MTTTADVKPMPAPKITITGPTDIRFGNWEADGVLYGCNDPTDVLTASAVIYGVPFYCEAFVMEPQKEGEEQRTIPALEDWVGDFLTAMAVDGPVHTAPINGRDYLIVITPEAR